MLERKSITKLSHMTEFGMEQNACEDGGWGLGVRGHDPEPAFNVQYHPDLLPFHRICCCSR